MYYFTGAQTQDQCGLYPKEGNKTDRIAMNVATISALVN